MTIRIVIADDHRIIREGLRSLLNEEPGLEVVGHAKNGREAVRLVRELSPDVVLLDVTMPDLNGIEAAGQIVTEYPRVKVIALSMHKDEHFVAGMLLAGASGYLLKDCSLDELAGAIRSVIQGGLYLSPGITPLVVKRYLDHLLEKEGLLRPPLSSREKEVLQLVAEGKTSKAIAAALHISTKTVETHRHLIMQKLGLNTIADLTKYAVRIGATSLEP
ncbi:MAG: response regulator transcription factor [Deltaproteobacteria bacterium]|nr:response regulator transcription factor [Deltaproteobacteria bacterium]